MTYKFTLPIKINANARGHSRFGRFKVKRQRVAARLAATAAWRIFANTHEQAALAAGVVVTITRIAPRPLDAHDNIRTANKPLIDGIADALGLKNDRDPRVTWAYAQARRGVREYGVEVELSTRRADLCPTCGQPSPEPK